MSYEMSNNICSNATEACRFVDNHSSKRECFYFSSGFCNCLLRLLEVNAVGMWQDLHPSSLLSVVN